MNNYISLGNYIEDNIKSSKSPSTILPLRSAYAGEWISTILDTNNIQTITREEWITIFKDLIASNLDEGQALALIISQATDKPNVDFDDLFFIEVNLSITDSSETIKHLSFLRRSVGFIKMTQDGKYIVELKGKDVSVPFNDQDTAKSHIINQINKDLLNGITPFATQ